MRVTVLVNDSFSQLRVVGQVNRLRVPGSTGHKQSVTYKDARFQEALKVRFFLWILLSLENNFMRIVLSVFPCKSSILLTAYRVK